jgi:hypothetical protein
MSGSGSPKEHGDGMRFAAVKRSDPGQALAFRSQCFDGFQGILLRLGIPRDGNKEKQGKQYFFHQWGFGSFIKSGSIYNYLRKYAVSFDSRQRSAKNNWNFHRSPSPGPGLPVCAPMVPIK